MKVSGSGGGQKPLISIAFHYILYTFYLFFFVFSYVFHGFSSVPASFLDVFHPMRLSELVLALAPQLSCDSQRQRLRASLARQCSKLIAWRSLPEARRQARVLCSFAEASGSHFKRRLEGKVGFLGGDLRIWWVLRVEQEVLACSSVPKAMTRYALMPQTHLLNYSMSALNSVQDSTQTS